jgi:hypothetical protein
MSKRRGLQKRATEALKPLGFIAITGTTFTRQVGEQLHFVGLQYRTSSSDITFNLGCHFKGVPSMFDFEPVAADDLQQLDCGLRIRVGRYIGDGFYDVWWNPDNSEVPAALAQATWAIERAFDDCKKKWGDGKLLIQKHVKNRVGSIRLSRPLFRWMWPVRSFHRFAFCALLAHHHSDDELASALFEKALSCEDSLVPSDVPKLSAALGLRRKRSTGKREKSN